MPGYPSRARRSRHFGHVMLSPGGSAHSERTPGSSPHKDIRQYGVTAWKTGDRLGGMRPAFRSATNVRSAEWTLSFSIPALALSLEGPIVPAGGFHRARPVRRPEPPSFVAISSTRLRPGGPGGVDGTESTIGYRFRPGMPGLRFLPCPWPLGFAAAGAEAAEAPAWPDGKLRRCGAWLALSEPAGRTASLAESMMACLQKGELPRAGPAGARRGPFGHWRGQSRDE
jgi:hypothetical protein